MRLIREKSFSLLGTVKIGFWSNGLKEMWSDEFRFERVVQERLGLVFSYIQTLRPIGIFWTRMGKLFSQAVYIYIGLTSKVSSMLCKKVQIYCIKMFTFIEPAF